MRNASAKPSVVTTPASSNLLALVRRGVIEKLDGSASDGGAFYRLVAPLGVERALRELTLL
jgi:hypothetical protein